MSQEFDIAEYWEQFDEKSRWVGWEPTIVPTQSYDELSDEDFIQAVDELVAMGEQEEEKEKERKTEEHEKAKRIVKKMYGCKNKHPYFLSEEEKAIQSKIDRIFNQILSEEKKT